MKLLKIALKQVPHKPLLNGLIIDFPDPLDSGELNPNILIGVNGSGKSQLLETIAEIFLYLDRLYRPVNKSSIFSIPILFEIIYIVWFKGNDVVVSIILTDPQNGPKISVVDLENNEVEYDEKEINLLLPQKVIGYTSGHNETLSLPFTDYYDEYAKYTGLRALEESKRSLIDYDPRFYLMDYTTNIGVLISNLLLGDETKVTPLIHNVGISELRSFQIVIQTNHSAAPSKTGVKLTAELAKWIEYLKNSATCYSYDSIEKKYILDFYNNGETKKAIQYFFNTPINFYTALYKIELLNNLIIKDSQLKEIKKQRSQRKLIIKPPTVPEQDKVLSYSEVKLSLLNGEVVDYINLSDGEHQYLNIFGTVLMTDFANCLYLFDEPETHFNPKWRREFISILTKIIHGRKQDYFITSHSPFIVADSKRDHVYIFKRIDNVKLEINHPTEETYGSDSDFILRIAFDLNTSLSKKSYDEITELSLSSDSTLIKKKISEFGDSAEKLFLFKRMEELKSKE